MSGRNKQLTLDAQAAARRIVQQAGADITQAVKILPLAKQLMSEAGCGIDTAKQHIARAVLILRGESVAKKKHGGRRPGVGFPAGTKRAGRRGKALP